MLTLDPSRAIARSFMISTFIHDGSLIPYPPPGHHFGQADIIGEKNFSFPMPDGGKKKAWKGYHGEDVMVCVLSKTLHSTGNAIIFKFGGKFGGKATTTNQHNWKRKKKKKDDNCKQLTKLKRSK